MTLSLQEFCHCRDRFSLPLARLSRLLLVGLIGFAVRSAGAGEPSAIDLAKDLKITLPKVEGVSTGVAEDELDKTPVLRLVFPDESMEAWQGHVDYVISAPSVGSYTLTFTAKSDPAECQIEVRVWGGTGQQRQVICPPSGYMLRPEWQEFTYDFVVEAGHQDVATIIWGNLARPGKTITLRDFRLVKN